jgi:hypothetical protein
LGKVQLQEVSPTKKERSVLGIDSAKRVFHAVGMDDMGKAISGLEAL